MNTFADNPLFLFMENVAPIISSKASKDTGRIVELSDTGCDARLSASNALWNTERHYPPKLSKITPNNGWKSYRDERIEDKSYRERSRVQNEQNAIDTEACYFIPRKEENNQQYWKKYPPYEESIDNTEFRLKSEDKDFGPKLRISPDRLRTSRLRQDNNSYEISSSARHDRNATRQYNSNEMKILRRDAQFQSYPTGSKMAAPGLKFVRSNYPNLEPKKHEVISNREKTIPIRQDCFEDFQFKEIPQESRRNYKDHYQRSNVPRGNTENFIDEKSQRNHRFSRGYSRSGRITGAATPNDLSQDWDEAAANKIRSRTCSPPTDRQKRTKSFARSFYGDEDQLPNRENLEILRDSEFASSNDSRFCQTKNMNCSCMEVSKRFVDRAVDKDSLSDIQNVCTSIEKVPNSAVVAKDSADRVEKNIVRTSFWEFIPLDNEDNEKKCKKVFGNKRSGGCPYQQQPFLSNNTDPLTKSLLKDSSVTARMTRRPIQRENHDLMEDSVNSKLYDDSPSPMKAQNASKIVNNRKNTFVNPFHKNQLSKPSMHTNEEKLNSNRITNSKIVEKLKSQEQNKYKSKSQSKISTKFTFGWTSKTNQYLKRPGSAPKSESNDEKKKKRLVNNGDLSNIETNIVERTATCLKRKLDKSRIEEASATLTQFSKTIGKKIRSEELTGSRLPIRIGDRLRSRNPSAGSRIIAKTYASKEEDRKIEIKESPKDSGGQLSSVRSRTKPKIKPSVILNELVDSAENFQSVSDIPVAGIKDCFEADPKLVEKSTDINVDLEENSTKFSKDEKLGTNIEDKEGDDSKMPDVKGNQRQRNTMSGNCGREMNQKNLKKNVIGDTSRSGFKEKCRFHLNDEKNIICNGYCNKDHGNLNSFRSRKPAAIRSQF